jgi:hypothetical protein
MDTSLALVEKGYIFIDTTAARIIMKMIQKSDKDNKRPVSPADHDPLGRSWWGLILLDFE